MTSTHAEYFGQSQPHTLPEGDGEPARPRNENVPTETDTAFTSVGGTNLQRERGPEYPRNEQDPEFRTDLIARIETLVQDFRDKKVAKLETLYQILRVVQEADVDEQVRHPGGPHRLTAT
jgi:hypothetical protein